ncbi:MAG TPA: hypothetical protein VFI22_13100, partial [Thermomicrobiales bacterium]|nr:hypothetical protein [Thermomicrobiales bacterium]
PDDPVRRCPDIAKARRLLGWSPRVGLDAGLRRTLAAMAAEMCSGFPDSEAAPPCAAEPLRAARAAGRCNTDQNGRVASVSPGAQDAGLSQ